MLVYLYYNAYFVLTGQAIGISQHSSLASQRSPAQHSTCLSGFHANYDNSLQHSSFSTLGKFQSFITFNY